MPALSQINEAAAMLAAGDRGFRLLVPTATMAEHLRNQLAREGFVFPPELVSTLTRFLAPFDPGPAAPPPAVLALLIQRELKRGAPAAFVRVAEFPGLANRLAALMEEISAAGCTAARFAGIVERPGAGVPELAAVAEVQSAVQRELERREWMLRGERLARQAAAIQSRGIPGIRRVFFDGFFAIAEAEMEVIRAIAAHAEVSLSLTAAGEAPAPRTVVVEARNRCAECDEVARRILTLHSQGHAWRDMGVIVRNPGAYVPALRLALERFGVPARFYAAAPASSAAVVRFLSGILDALLDGWDYETLAGSLASPLSGLGGTPEGDEFEFALKEISPGRGLDGLRSLAKGPHAVRLVKALERLDGWRSERRDPAEWAACGAALSGLVPLTPVAEPLAQRDVEAARETVAALGAFRAAFEQAAGLMPDDAAIPLSEIWDAARAILRLTSLRPADRRRDAVAVIDAFEARQWELPCVFVCGLLEKEFPQYPPEDPILDDAARRTLARAGLKLRTTEDRRREERLLFDIAVSRATEVQVLSYPRYNAEGDENLRSFFLDEILARADVEWEAAVAARPAQRGEPRTARRAPIAADDLLERLARQHAALAPTAVEDYLQCPFLFFARHTLNLEPAPCEPDERLDTPLQGRILHAVLAELARQPQDAAPLLATIFDKFCDGAGVPPGYRREAVRLELQRHLQKFLDEDWLPENWRAEVEKKFELDLEGIRIHGRIDRIDTDPVTGRAVVTDYKYSSSGSVKKLMKAYEQGWLVQGGLYALAAERCFGLTPVASVYRGLRGEPSCEGWRAGAPELPKTVTDCAPDVFRAVLDGAAERALDAAAAIRAGAIAPDPKDRDKCGYCAFADVCRVEVEPARVSTTGGAQ